MAAEHALLVKALSPDGPLALGSQPNESEGWRNLGAPAGATRASRGISPNFAEDVLGSTNGAPVKCTNCEARLSFTSGTVQVIIENNNVITVIAR